MSCNDGIESEIVILEIKRAEVVLVLGGMKQQIGTTLSTIGTPFHAN